LNTVAELVSSLLFKECPDLPASSIYSPLTVNDVITRRLNFLLAATHHDFEDNITRQYTSELMKVTVFYDAAHLYLLTR